MFGVDPCWISALAAANETGLGASSVITAACLAQVPVSSLPAWGYHLDVGRNVSPVHRENNNNKAAIRLGLTSLSLFGNKNLCLTGFKSTGAFALHTLPFGFNPDDAMGTQGIGV